MSQDSAAPFSAPPAPPGLPMGYSVPPPSTRSTSIVVCLFTFILCLAVLFLVHAPYAIFAPGPATNTLASYQGKPFISVTGHATYPTSGALYFTTVEEYGGPGSRMSLFAVLRAWLSPTEAALPQDQVFPPDQTSQQIDQTATQDMTTSQEDATVAALHELGIAVPETVFVGAVSKGVPAAKLLKAGDQVTSIDGTKVKTNDQLHALITAHKPGSVLKVGVKRAGESMVFSVKTTKGTDGRTLIGISPTVDYHPPIKVTFGTQDVGGPSAGTMFALALYDTLTPGDLTGGQRIAGTGEIDPADGSVQPIGGIAQKMVGAKRAGAQWFLAPDTNCDEVVGHVPSGLHVVKISTLHQARLDVQAIAAGQGGTLATCG